MEKGASEGKEVKGLELLAGTECPTPSLHPPSHSLCILAYSLLTGCEASFLYALEMKWQSVEVATMWSCVTSHPTISSGN